MEDKVIEQNSVEQASREATVRRIRETFNEIYLEGSCIVNSVNRIEGRQAHRPGQVSDIDRAVDAIAPRVDNIHRQLEYLAFKLKPWLPELEDPDSPLFQVTEQEIEEELAKHNDER